MPKISEKIVFLFIICILATTAAAQTAKRKPPVKKTTVPATVEKNTETEAETPAKTPQKRNERPSSADQQTQDKANSRPANAPAGKNTPSFTPTYFYEFTQPDFPVSKIDIQHDAAGNGTITFEKFRSDEAITDPIHLTPPVLERINKALGELNFLDSTEDYQYEKDYSHLGNVKFRLMRDGKERSTAFNWTVNKNAKAIADEYRKISNQYIWMFDLSVARENQPLETPRLMDSLDSLIQRKEIADVKQMSEFLKTLVNDERLPLIARNHAARLVKQSEKK